MKFLKMTFRNKLFFIYALFTVVMITLIGNLYFYQNSRYLIHREEQTLRYNAEQIASRFDDTVARMNHGIEFLLSDINALDSIILLGSAKEGSFIPQILIDDACSQIRKTLHSYFLEKYFYRVVYFNQNGYVIANNNRDHSIINPDIDIHDLSWIDQVSGRRGKSKLLGLHKDEWGQKQNPIVFSLVKEIQGDSLGYIEVQYLADDLADIIKKPDDQTNVMLFTIDGALLYAAEQYQDLSHYRTIALTAKDPISNYENEITGVSEMIAVYRSDVSETVLLSIENLKDIRNRQFVELSYMIVTWIIIAVTSIAFVWFFAWKLTKPIKQIETLIEQTEINNIGQKLNLDQSVASDEIISLYESYRSLMKRLSDSIEKEKQSSLLQMQAQFDTLQAQINPHFIYNILNVISQRSLMAGDETTCEICGCLADILRYSTSTKDKTSTIEEELTYLEKYCFLLKTRYQHRFEYTCKIDDSIKKAQLPKLTLQQLIENSIKHGFSNSSEIMRIKIDGWIEGDDVTICMQDNGQGFDQQTIEALNTKFFDLRQKLQSGGQIPNLEIGGMGLVNTYARLYLLYKDDLIFEVSNDGGAKISIGFRMNGEETKRDRQ